MKAEYLYIKNIVSKDMCNFITKWLLKKMEFNSSDEQCINSPALHSGQDLNYIQLMLIQEFIKRVLI